MGRKRRWWPLVLSGVPLLWAAPAQGTRSVYVTNQQSGTISQYAARRGGALTPPKGTTPP